MKHLRDMTHTFSAVGYCYSCERSLSDIGHCDRGVKVKPQVSIIHSSKHLKILNLKILLLLLLHVKKNEFFFIQPWTAYMKLMYEETSAEILPHFKIF